MSKANQKFAQADEAVSPVIGVILMVAITVVLAAVVFVLVSNLSKGTGEANEAASATVSSPLNNTIYITLVKEGSNGNYTFTNLQGSEAVVTIDGNTCNFVAATAGRQYLTGGDLNWAVGETLQLKTDCAGEFTTMLVSASIHTVSVTLHGTLILDNARVTIN